MAHLVIDMANLEVLLPVFWNTQVRHMLLCRFIPQLDEYGSFWAIAMLVIECYHCLIKKLGRSRKNMMASIVNNYEIFDIRHTQWETQTGEDKELAELCTRYDMFPEKPDNMDVSLGKRQKQTPVVLGQSDYFKIINLYQYPKDTVLSKLVIKYLSMLKKLSDSSPFVYLHNWVAKNLTVAEKALQQQIAMYSKMTKNHTKVRSFVCNLKYFRTIFVPFSYHFRTSFVPVSYQFWYCCKSFVTHIYKSSRLFLKFL